MNLVIISQKGLEGYQFGEHRDIIRKIVPDNRETLRAQAWDTVDTDFYDRLGLRFTYNDAYEVESIGLAPTSNAFFENISLKTNRIKNLLKQFRKKGHTPQKYQEIYYFDSIGLAVYCDGEKIEAYELYKGEFLDNCEKVEKKANEYYRDKT